MNDIEKMLAGYQYIKDTGNIAKTVDEFISTFDLVIKLMSDKEVVERMNPMDICDFLVHMKNFNDNIKPIAIKYGILPNIIGGDQK